ncbi:C-type lectin-like [Haliotis cracherodii]|uniref:C-type lectin-like n=1 Tax=Haliotis cracherodii TaxID=6455 RepID=UPI0039EAF06F
MVATLCFGFIMVAGIVRGERMVQTLHVNSSPIETLQQETRKVSSGLAHLKTSVDAFENVMLDQLDELEKRMKDMCRTDMDDVSRMMDEKLIQISLGRYCPSDFQYNKTLNICFKLITAKKTWTDANTNCLNLGKNGRLVILDEREKFSAVQRYVTEHLKGGVAFVGGKRLSGKRPSLKRLTGKHLNGTRPSGKRGDAYEYTWINGKPIEKGFWCPNEPNDGMPCVDIWKQTETCLDDTACNYKAPSLCELPMS